MLQYDSSKDQHVKADFKELQDSGNEEETKESQTLDPLLVLRRKSRISKARSTFIHYFNLSRIITKSGKRNVFLIKLPNKHIFYIRDLGYTLITIRWRWILLALCLVNFISYLLFANLWMLVANISGDFDRNQTEYCIMNSNSFTGYFLLSVETVTTIGYGYRNPTEKCEGGWFLLLLQSMLSVGVQGTLITAVYVKTFSPSYKRFSSSLFSRTAVICLRDGKLRFMFRIHDFFMKIWCGTTISLYFIDKETNSDYIMQTMKIEPYGLLIFPLEIEHVIDEKSPLWRFRPLDILRKRYEIVAVAEGSSTITGQVSQNRTSYSNSDILWGHRFKPCVEYEEQKECHVINFKNFKRTVPFDTPLCSARKLADLERNIYDLSMNEYRSEVEHDRKLTLGEKRKREKEKIPEVMKRMFRKESVTNPPKL